MLDIDDKWPKKIDNLIYLNRKLNLKERKYINNNLNKRALNLFINLRYATDPIYDKMTKKELINELKYSRYNE